MNPRIVRTIFFKELLDTVRDRRAVIMMVAVPVLLYPGLVLIGLQIALLQQSQMDATLSRVALDTASGRVIAPWVGAIPKVMLTPSNSPRADLEEGRIDAVVVSPPGAADLLEHHSSIDIEVLFDSTESRSVEAAARVLEGLDQVRLRLQKSRLSAMGYSEDYINPVDVERKDIAPPAKATGNLIGLVLPVLLVLMLAIGAFYPAVDVTAGEKERGTFETLLSTPVNKLEIVAGKYLAVCTMSIVAGLLNLASMLATFVVVFRQLEPLLGERFAFALSLPPGDVAIMLLILIPLAACIGAFTMCVAVLARSFREAQSYVTPFFLVVAMPALYASVPGMRLDEANRFYPIANCVLLFRELMIGRGAAEGVLSVFASTAIHALIGVLLAVWMFQREDVVLAEDRGVALTLRRRDIRPRPRPTPGFALGMFAAVMLALFYVASPLQQRDLLAGLLATQWLVLLPMAAGAAWYWRIGARETFSLRMPRPLAIAGALIGGIGWAGLSIQIGVWSNRVLPMPEAYLEAMRGLFALGHTPAGLAILLFALAVTPALCEEAIFRGVILSGLRPRIGAWPAALVSGLMFGVFHLSVHRLLATALSGVVLGAAVLCTRSIAPAVLVHACLNGLGVLAATGWLPVPPGIEQQGLPLLHLLAAAALFATGAALLASPAARSRD